MRKQYLKEIEKIGELVAESKCTLKESQHINKLLDELCTTIERDIQQGPIQACLDIAKGCHDYGGGHHDKRDAEIYHHGIQTVVNSLQQFRNRGFSDYQVAVTHSIGKNQK